VNSEGLTICRKAAEELAKSPCTDPAKFELALSQIVARYRDTLEDDYASRALPQLRTVIADAIEQVEAVAINDKALTRLALGVAALEASENAEADATPGLAALPFDYGAKGKRAVRIALHRLAADLQRIGDLIGRVPPALGRPIDTPEQNLVVALGGLWRDAFGSVPKQPVRRVPGGRLGAFGEWLKVVGRAIGDDADRKRLDEIWRRALRKKLRQNEGAAEEDTHGSGHPS
jgi:hypothetical protein